MPALSRFRTLTRLSTRWGSTVYYVVLIAQGPLHLSPLQTAVRLAPCGVWGRLCVSDIALPLNRLPARFHYHFDLRPALAAVFHKEDHRYRSGRVHSGEHTFRACETLPKFLGGE